MIFKPHIQYPAEAMRAGMIGSGIVLVEVNSATGEVISTRMGKSTGYAVLDQAATRAFQRARFTEGTENLIKIPITFSRTGPVVTSYDVKSKNMDDVLAHFLGKGTVLKRPIPEYPRSPAWTNKSGKGVYELHADKDGKVEGVKILKSSGDATFDRVAMKSLGRWRLRRGPLVLELPLSFTLTPMNYSVDVDR
jgi:TonB family protein